MNLGLKRSCSRLGAHLISSPRRFYQILVAGAAALAFLGAVPAPAWADQMVPYQVKPGDTVFDLAHRFGISADSIQLTNALANPDDLAVGQILIINLPIAESPLAPSGRQPTSYQLTTYVTEGGLDSSSLIKIPTSPNPLAIVGAPAASPVLKAPYYSQFDGSIWGGSNCGPTSLSMALGALDIKAGQIALRNLANKQMGWADPNSGTTWESLAYAAKTDGAQVTGLYNGQSYRKWSVDDLKVELDLGHPVLLLVRYWNLPDHTASGYGGDHYVVALGVNGDGNIVYHDPASSAGAYRTITPATLEKAWTNTAVGLVRTAMALTR